MAWQFLGVSNVVQVTATSHALVTTGIAGTLQAGDLLIACISSRIASTTSITLPITAEWTLVSEQKNNNVLTTGSAAASGLMAYCVRGASDPDLTFTHPVAPSVALGRIVAYRDVDSSAPKDTQTSFTTATGITAVSGTGLTTTQANDLIVAMAAGGQEAAWSSFNATSPVGASGATSTAAPTTTWLERADSLTTTGADTSLAVFDAIKAAAGATGNLTATASVAAAHVVIAGAFKIAPPSISDAWNANDKSASITLSNSDKTATTTATSTGVRSTTVHPNGTAGKYYAEFLLSTRTSNPKIGIKSKQSGVSSLAESFTCVAFSGDIIDETTTVGTTGSGSVSADVICLAWDSGAKKIWFRENNGLWNNNAAANPATGTNGLSFSGSHSNVDYCLAFVAGNSGGDVIALRTEVADFTYTGPSGFTSWMGEALAAPGVTGAGTPAAQAGAAAGAGISSSVGAGTPSGQAATVSSTGGVSGSAGTGTPAAQAAAVSGLGSVGAAAATGTGALAAGASTVSGSGVSASVATGALAAQAATVAGAGVSASDGSGALAAQSSVASGAGVTASSGTGALQAEAGTVTGSGASDSTGTGALVAQASTVAGVGASASVGIGALEAAVAAVAGTGASVSTGTGSLVAGSAEVDGAGLVASVGTGTLVAGPATVTGEGVVIEEGVTVGTGVLVAGAATISGAGEVTGEVAPPIFVGGGGIYRPQRPFPVEGVGYAILPQIEGEAHGFVVAVGAGVAAIPRITGAAGGTAGVDGRSAARLTVKAAAVGERGQAGAAHAVLKGLSVTSAGVSGARGVGSGAIVLKGAATGRHDDDEAAIMALLLAA
jgi:hypothetical protein